MKDISNIYNVSDEELITACNANKVKYKGTDIIKEFPCKHIFHKNQENRIMTSIL